MLKTTQLVDVGTGTGTLAAGATVQDHVTGFTCFRRTNSSGITIILHGGTTLTPCAEEEPRQRGELTCPRPGICRRSSRHLSPGLTALVPVP